MNGRERIAAALRGERPDRVPVMLHNFLMAAGEAGFTQREYRDDARRIAETFVRSVERYRYDGVVLDIDTTVLAGAVGVPVDFPEREPARLRGGLLSSLEEVPALRVPRLEDYRYVGVWLEAARLLVERLGDEVCVRGNCDQAPFSLASMVRSPEGWLTDLLDEERQELVFDLLEKCAQVTCRFVELMAQTGVHMVSNGDSPAGPALISPAMYRRYALPFERRVAEAAHRAGLPWALHVCGDTTPILAAMLESGADAVELDYKTDLGRAHQAFGERIAFIGNIDPSGVLALGRPEEVRRKTVELLEAYTDSPRFILNAGCAIPRETPPANLRAMIGTARAWRC